MTSGALSHDAIHERFVAIVADSLRIEPSQVTKDSYLDDLGAESLDLIEITMESETAFDVLMPEQSILETAQTVFGEGVLEKDGALTSVGRRFIRQRMPDVDPAAVVEGATTATLQREFLRVGTWVHLIAGLMEQTPRVCEQCDVPREKSSPGVLKCSQCGSEAVIPAGDDLNERWVRDYYEKEFLPLQQSSAAVSSQASAIDVAQRA